jgi:dihydrofolate synthase/folylpolyglutamate synthase
MAFKLAEIENIRVMVSEAGMGGRWDATNAADAVLVGFTGVSLEHTDILGGTVEEIAAEKAEVIKNNSSVAVLTGDRRVLEILDKKAKKENANLFLAGRDFKVARVQNMGLKGWDLDISGINSDYNNINLPVLGDYQPLNLSLAVVLAELYLGIRGRELDREILASGLDDLYIKGRFEILMQQPVVIADAAHNPEGIKNFAGNVSGYFKGRKIIVIFAVLKDKDYRAMIGDVLKISDMLILTSSLNSRSLGSEDLETETLREMGRFQGKGRLPPDIYRIDNIENSLRFALKISEVNDIICITGSITNLEHLGSMVKRLSQPKQEK